MSDKQIKLQSLHEKIRKGLDLSFRKLVAYKKKNNGLFVFSENGKVVKIKAIDLKL